MSEATTYAIDRDAAMLPGAPIIARIRRLIIVALVADAAYAMLATAQRWQCIGGSAAGAETCTSMQIGPSPVILFAIATIVVVSLGRVLRRAVDEPSAVRIIDRAAIAIAIVAAACGVIAQVWFWALPAPDPSGPFTLVFPFPFASGSLTTTP